jgi:hypothetical protein
VQGRPPLRRHQYIKSTPPEGLAAPPPWWWCLLGELCFLCGFWLVTRQSYLSYIHFRGVTKWATQACTIPQEAKVSRLVLAELRHPQPPTPIHINNTTTVGIIYYTIKRQWSRSMEMRYFWLLDGETQKYFKFYYQPGLENLGDYPSKHHTADIHQHVRPYYVHMDNSPTLLPRAMKPSTHWGCAEILGDPYSKKSPLPSIGTSPRLAASPKDTSYRVLCQSRIHHRHITRNTTLEY